MAEVVVVEVGANPDAAGVTAGGGYGVNPAALGVGEKAEERDELYCVVRGGEEGGDGSLMAKGGEEEEGWGEFWSGESKADSPPHRERLPTPLFSSATAPLNPHASTASALLCL